MTILEQVKQIPGIKELHARGIVYSLLGGIGLIASAYAFGKGTFAAGAKFAIELMADELDKEFAEEESNNNSETETESSTN